MLGNMPTIHLRSTTERIQLLIQIMPDTRIITATTIRGMGGIRGRMPMPGIQRRLGTPILTQTLTGFPTPDGADLPLSDC